MYDVIKSLQKKLIEKNISDYQILRLSEDGTLTIVGSFDFSYYHNVEIYFKGTKYISCPTSFDAATFRLATEEERLSIKGELYDGCEDTTICIAVNEDIPNSCVKHFIVTEEIQYKFETVYYYRRENLKEDERIADWIK